MFTFVGISLIQEIYSIGCISVETRFIEKRSYDRKYDGCDTFTGGRGRSRGKEEELGLMRCVFDKVISKVVTCYAHALAK